MSLPEILNIGYAYSPEQLWLLDIPSETMPLTHLRENMHIKYLDQEGTDDWNLTHQELIDDQERELLHMQKVYDADMSYPIEIYNHQDTWIILDGVHRFVKAHLR